MCPFAQDIQSLLTDKIIPILALNLLIAQQIPGLKIAYTTEDVMGLVPKLTLGMEMFKCLEIISQRLV